MAQIELHRTVRVVAVVLAAAFLVALAGPSSQSAAAKPSACATASKTLRAAEARLAHTQRKARQRKSSRTALAKARRAVKRARRARRAACRIPASAPPASTQAPPSPQPPPPGQPSPPEGSQPEPPPSSPPTSHALIAKALADGRIDAETALRYRVFAEFGDSRLPEEFRGAPLDVTDTPTLEEAAQRWDQLSAATRAALDPFFVPPFNPGSWYDPDSQASARAARSAAAADGMPGADLCASTAPDMKRWGYVTAAAGKLRVWYESTRPGQLEKAVSVAEYLDAGAWADVVGVFRAPLPDGGDLAGRRCRGLDPAADLVLADIKDVSGRAVRYFDKPGCAGPIPGFLLVRRDLTGKALKATVVHELAHLTHYAYSGSYCRDGIAWLTEATAAWTENHVGDLGPDNPERYAPWFLDRPGLPLETWEDVRTTSTPRQYGSYLFFQWLAKHAGAEALGQVWYFTESGDAPIDTTQQVLEALGYDGGFDSAWKQFALAGLNPRRQVDWFRQWGLPLGAFADNDTVFADGGELTLPVSLPHLSAQYHALTFSDAVKGIQVRNPLAGRPGASVQAWLRIQDGAQERIEVRDLSNAEQTTFCRDLPAENVQELALVVANAVHAPKSPVLVDDLHVRGTPTCGGYDGTAKITIRRDGLTEVYSASYSMGFKWSRPIAGGGTETYLANDSGKDMHATWSISGVSDSDGCSYSGSASFPEGPWGLEARIHLRDFGPGHPQTRYEHGYGVAFQIAWVRRTCPSGSQTDIPWQLGHGVQSQPHPWDPEAEGITGSETRDLGGGVKIDYEWSLSRS